MLEEEKSGVDALAEGIEKEEAGKLTNRFSEHTFKEILKGADDWFVMLFVKLLTSLESLLTGRFLREPMTNLWWFL